jgi:hypothetical protein
VLNIAQTRGLVLFRISAKTAQRGIAQSADIDKEFNKIGCEDKVEDEGDGTCGTNGGEKERV